MTEKDELIRKINLRARAVDKDYRSLCKTMTELRKAKDKALAREDNDLLWKICKDIAETKEGIQYYLGLEIGMSEAVTIIHNFEPELAERKKK